MIRSLTLNLRGSGALNPYENKNGIIFSVFVLVLSHMQYATREEVMSTTLIRKRHQR